MVASIFARKEGTWGALCHTDSLTAAVQEQQGIVLPRAEGFRTSDKSVAGVQLCLQRTLAACIPCANLVSNTHACFWDCRRVLRKIAAHEEDGLGGAPLLQATPSPSPFTLYDAVSLRLEILLGWRAYSHMPGMMHDLLGIQSHWLGL